MLGHKPAGFDEFLRIICPLQGLPGSGTVDWSHKISYISVSVHIPCTILNLESPKMKHFAIFSVLMIAAAVLIAGCGKSEEFKKLESDMYASVTAMHDDGMSMMNKGNDLSAKIDDAIAMYDSMAAKYPKQFEGQSSDDLKAAKEKLSTATTSMKEWMSEMKPYDPTMDHMQVMAQLTKSKDGITKVKADFQDAFSAATTALMSHKAFAEDMATNLAAGVKKVGKK